MNILAHRGYWNKTIKHNSEKAIRYAIEKGFGFESDIRDYCERLVISHNIADKNALDAEVVFKWLHEFEDKYTFAINIKADGLKDVLSSLLTKYEISNYFLFDMSVPQMVEFMDMNLNFFTRQSEIELNPCLYDKAAGVWIDGFWSTDWITERLLKEHLKNEKKICLVSPELHGRSDYKLFWKRIKDYVINDGNVMLCTDVPDEAKEYFNE
ncbi:hypothetical protein SAMN02910357_02104 [Succinivibrio dextrinosolvens]|uniref:hypothetical protein n=1 Tax=Succinivibrio dextrinosolvens TaxID=83771 RepID=UPI0008E72762|nr:hypothetical protein [Succinivibrio dextrinosolvens]SFS83281.1 hypothetical protein SAMN02910357_02104 [Succinivibrio dextrinosolvens]